MGRPTFIPGRARKTDLQAPDKRLLDGLLMTVVDHSLVDQFPPQEVHP